MSLVLLSFPPWVLKVSVSHHGVLSDIHLTLWCFGIAVKGLAKDWTDMI
jgi:hypothetical protein